MNAGPGEKAITRLNNCGLAVPTESAYVGAFLRAAVAAACAGVIAVFVTPTRRRRRAKLAVEPA